MKQINLFVCELCGTQYADKQKAKDCEANHKIPEKIESCRYNSKNQNEKGYPLSVSIRFKNGEVVQYRR